jgi:hypothetical protein
MGCPGDLSDPNAVLKIPWQERLELEPLFREARALLGKE